MMISSTWASSYQARRAANSASVSRALAWKAALLDLLGRRWSLRRIWELREQTLTSRDLRAACDEVSPTVSQARLNELLAAGLVGHRAGEGYHLTELGAELMQAFTPLYAFAERWTKR